MIELKEKSLPQTYSSLLPPRLRLRIWWISLCNSGRCATILICSRGVLAEFHLCSLRCSTECSRIWALFQAHKWWSAPLPQYALRYRRWCMTSAFWFLTTTQIRSLSKGKVWMSQCRASQLKIISKCSIFSMRKTYMTTSMAQKNFKKRTPGTTHSQR